MARLVGSFQLVLLSFQLLSAEYYITKGLCHLITWPWGDGTVGEDAASVTLFTSLHPLVSVWEEYLPQMLPKLHHYSYFHLDDCLNPSLKLYHRWLHHHNVSLHASSYCLQPKQKMFLLFLDLKKKNYSMQEWTPKWNHANIRLAFECWTILRCSSNN